MYIERFHNLKVSFDAHLLKVSIDYENIFNLSNF